MDIYEFWLYKEVLNTHWFVWALVLAVFGGNLLMPLILWMLLGGKRMSGKTAKKQK